MKKKPLVVSYYNENTPYEKEAQDLIASCKKFDLDYDIVSVPNLGSWSANCCYKPEFLLAKLEEHDRPLIWTDADSIFNKEPILFNECYADVAMRVNDHVAPDDNAKVLTGTLFFNTTASSKKLLTLWKKECERHMSSGKETVLDQVCLRKVILHYPTIVEMKRLPISYVYIVDNPHDRANVHEDAVVVHYQASRLYRKMIDGEVTSTLADHLSPEELKRVRT